VEKEMRKEVAATHKVIDFCEGLNFCRCKTVKVLVVALICLSKQMGISPDHLLGYMTELVQGCSDKGIWKFDKTQARHESTVN
jgi:hypothetical protein